ncbi:MAG: protein kinase, partial [Nannocystaceae bacterium]
MEAERRSTSRSGRSASPDAATDLGDRLLRGKLYEKLFPSLARPSARVVRFALLRELGRGGMGMVFAAYDEQLDRKVALKLLHSHTSGDDQARERLLREAQALARLSHPNVVQVHEAGVHEGQVYLVMELVEGRTLRAWLEDEVAGSGGARWRAVLEVMLAAGEGLAAAHEVGLTHRDFKPDNVLVGDDGRVRVADFGLATEGREHETSAEASTEAGAPTSTEVRTTDAHAGSSQSSSIGERTPRPLARLTKTGTAVGTVLYMPLEQLTGRHVDARSDQFSFCVTLYEALFGERPFQADTPLAMVSALEDGEPRVPKAVAEVPRWLRRVLWRGLSKEPDGRFESMRALLEALTMPMRRRRMGMVSAAVLVALGTGLGFAMARGEVAESEPCAEAGRAMDETWNDDARQRLRNELPEAAAGFAVDAIDQWTQGWRQTALTACEQVHVDRIASEESLDVRGHCLEEQRHRLGSVLGVVEAHGEGGPAVVDALAILTEPDDCLLDRGEPLVGLSDEQLADHRRLSDRLVELDLGRAGQDVPRRREDATQVYEEARALGLEEILRRAAFLQGRLALLSSDREAAERWLGEAIDRAEQMGLDGERAVAWLRMVELSLHLELDPGRARWSWSRAQPAVATRRRPSRAHALSDLALGQIDLAVGELEQAGARFDSARAELVELGPPGIVSRALALRLRSIVATRQGDGELALELSTRASDLRRAARSAGAGLEDTGTAIYDRGVALLSSGTLDEARSVLVDARRRLEQELPDSVQLGRAHVALAAVADAEGRVEDAIEHAERADAILRAIGGPSYPERVPALSARGVAAFRHERFEAAVESFDLAVRIVERGLEP